MGARRTTGRRQSRALTPWHDAVRSADIARVKALLASGANVNALDERGQTALINAVIWGNVEIARLLIQRGAELNHTAALRLTALYLAVIRKRPDFVKILVEAGADARIKGSTDQYDCTPLEYAQRYGYAESVEILKKAPSP